MAELVMSAAEIAADPARWLEERRGGVTATDAATIVGVSPWDSPFALWHRKAGNLPDVPDSDRMRLGRYLEDYISERWLELRGDYAWTEGGLFRDGWRMATPDALVWRASDAMGLPLECKSVGSWDGWGPSGAISADGVYEAAGRLVPAYVRVQALWQADVLGVPVAHVAALHRLSGEFRWYALDAAGEDMRDCLRKLENCGLEIGELP